MPDLVTWLRARLDDDEAACRREIDGPVHEGPCINYKDQDPAYYDEHQPCERHCNRYRPYGDPRRGLAEVEAKRRILEAFVQADALVGGFDEEAIGYQNGLGHAVALLALSYADQPGYKEEWRP